MELLIKKAKEASMNSYSPYSKFKVGAALITKDNKIYQGCNIENASYGLTNCAERSCLFNAYSDGVRKDDIVALALYSPKNHLVSPCGACRQVMQELLNENTPIYMAYGDNKFVATTVKELLPFGFDKEDMDND